MTAPAVDCGVDIDALLRDYLDYVASLGLGERSVRDRTRIAREFLSRNPNLAEWLALPASERAAELRSSRAWPLLCYAIGTDRVRLDVELAALKQLTGLGHAVEMRDLAGFSTMRDAGNRLGWTSSWIETVLGECLAVLLACRGGLVADLTAQAIDEFDAALSASSIPPSSRRAYRARLASLRQLLYETRVVDTAPRRRNGARSLEQRFTEVVMAEPIRQTLSRYIQVRAAVLRPKSVESLINDLLPFAEYLTTHHPEITCLSRLDRACIEGYLAWNRTRGWRGRRAAAGAGRIVSVAVTQSAVLSLRNLLDDITAWGWEQAPSQRLLFAADVPKLDQPLPRALAPDVDAAVMNAVARLDDPFARVGLTVLRGAGLRVGELLDLELGSIIDYGPAGSWLKVPLGKLATERMVPLSAATIAALDEWVAHRGLHRPLAHPRTGVPTDFLFTQHGRRLGYTRLRNGLLAAAESAGLHGPDGGVLVVTPHQLRHTWATELANAGMSLQALMALLGHYVGDLVKWMLSGGCVVEAGEQSVEDLFPPDLALGVRVVALSLQGWAELDGGLEEGAGLADRFEVTIEADGASAVAVAEHAGVHLSPQPGHLRAFGVGGQRLWGVVEGLDLLRDGEVFLGDGAVGDSCINHGHPHRSMSEKGSDRFQGHATVDGLSGQGVAQAMRADVSDPGRCGDLGHGPVDTVVPDALAVFNEQVAAAQAGRSAGEPLVEEVLKLGMQRNVAVVAQLAQRHMQPVGGADLHHGIDCEIEEFTLAQAGAGQEFHTQAHERVGIGAGGLQQFGERGVIEEAGQRLVADGQVPGEHEHPGRDIVTVPFGEAFKAGAQRAEVLGRAGLGQRAAARRRAGGQVQLVGLDVRPVQIGDAADGRGVEREPAGELAQHAFDPHHRRGTKRQPGLSDVAGQRGRQPGRHRRPGSCPLRRAVPVGLARRGIKQTEVKQGGLRTEQRGTERLGAVAVGAMPADGGHQRFSPGLDRRLRQLLGGQSGHGGHLDQRRPLQPGHHRVEAQFGGARAEPSVECPMVVGGDLAEVRAAGHQVVGAGPDPAGHDQPADHPAVLEGQRTLFGQRQSGPPVDADPGEERAGHRGHRVRGEHARRGQIGPVGDDQLLDVGAAHR
jgi:integrase